MGNFFDDFDAEDFAFWGGFIETQLEGEKEECLATKDLTDFAEVTASESPAPGGGSISAYVGTLGAALGTMVANLSSHKRGWDDKWEVYSQQAEKGQEIMNTLLNLVDEDTKAFDAIIQAMRLPKSTDQDQEIRKRAIDMATKNAIEVPLKVMKVAYSSMSILKEMAVKGLQSSISDVGVGVACARTAVLGAYLNVKINCRDMDDESYVQKILEESKKIKDKAIKKEAQILEIIEDKINNKT